MLNRLLVGNCIEAEGEVAALLQDLRLRLVQLEAAASALRTGAVRGRDVSLYGPYVGRAYLETATTALITRHDPFRVLAAKRHQDSTYYDAKQRNKSAINWSGDVMSPTKPTEQLWAKDIAEAGVRSLLGQWAEEIVWIPAFERFSDALGAFDPAHDWIVDLSKKPVDSFCPELRSSLDGLFSKFSKGVHSELLGERQAIFDLVSITSDYRDLAQRLTGLALLSHFSEHFSHALEPTKAFTLADRIGSNWK